MAHKEPIRKRMGAQVGGPGGGAGSPRGLQQIPDKLYFRIGEVAKLCEVPAYVLRFWEGEFPQLKPNKGGTGQRLYRRRDVEMALRIKTLLYDEGYTIPGARQAFKAELRTGREIQPGQEGVEGGVATGGIDQKHLVELQKELREIYTLLARPAVTRPAVQSIRPPRPAPVSKPRIAPTPFPRSPLQMERDAARDRRSSRSDSLFDHLPLDQATETEPD